MYTLFIDTHCNKIVLVLYKDNKILEKKEIETNYSHSISTMPNLIELMESNKLTPKDLNELIVVNGPGSFTGIRIGVTIAKTLAYTLNIPIKVLSSLEIKAVSFEHAQVKIIEREKNGVFIGEFTKDNKLLSDYQYLKNSEYENTKKGIEDVKIDYEKILLAAKNKKATNPHQVNPLYVKKIEVQK